MKIRAKIDAVKILNARGLGRDKRAWKFLANDYKAKMDKRVPMQTGTLKNASSIDDAGDKVCIRYGQPYAHYQYHGVMMAGRAPKHYTGRPLTYNQAPMRGSKWDVRTWQAEGGAILSDLAKYVGGRTK